MERWNRGGPDAARGRPAGVPARAQRFRAIAAAAQDGRRLDEVLLERLPEALGRPLSKSTVRRLIMAGAVRLDGRPVRRPGLPLAAGTRLEVLVRPGLSSGAAPAVAPFRLSPAAVLYEDDALIAVDKPAGLPTHATADPRRPHLVAAVQAYLARPRPGPRRAGDAQAARAGDRPYLGLHQRLDRDTSGIVLFTKDPAANRALAGQFAGRRVEKVYRALTRRPSRRPPREWSAALRIGVVGTGRRARVAGDAAGGAEARTDFRLLEELPRALLVEAQPRTGRKHQIRIHLAAAGLHVLGDETYGVARPAPAVPRLMLHACRLVFRHPLTARAIALRSPDPPDFEAALQALRAEAGPAGRVCLTRRRTRPKRRRRP